MASVVVPDEDTLGPNVCYANRMMESFRGPIHHQTQRPQRPPPQLIWSPNVLRDPSEDQPQNNNPLQLLTCPSQVGTGQGRDLKKRNANMCHTMELTGPQH